MIDGSGSGTDLEAVVGLWDGSSIFTEVVPSTSTPGPKPAEDAPSRPSGSASSPISIHSTPSPLHRPRAKAICSRLADTAFDAPRPVRPLVTFLDLPHPPRVRSSNHDIHLPPRARKPDHPFFSRDFRRAHSAPLRAPRPNRPTLVAHYSSTSASTSQTTQPTPATLDSPRKDKGKDRLDVWRVDGFEIELDNYVVPTRSTGEESEQEEMVEVRVTEEEIRHLAESLESMVLPPARPPPVTIPKMPPPYISKSRKGKNKNPGLPEYDHSTYSPPPKVVYTRNADEANDLLSCLKGEVLGFDMEWPTAGQADQKGRMVGRRWNAEKKVYENHQPKTALLQFCDTDMIVMVHIWHMDRMPEKVVEIMADRRVYKTGVAISNDGKKLLRDYPDAFPDGIASLLELSHVARRVDPINTGPGKTLIALAKLVAIYLGKYLDKSRDLRAGNWTLPLSPEAAAYAANDVHAGLYLYLALCDLGHANGIEVDLPELALQLPAIGQQVVTRIGKPIELKVVGTPEATPIQKPTGKTIIKDADGKTLVTPAKMQALESFKAGMTTVDMAAEKGIQVKTIQGYILSVLPHLPPDSLDIPDKKRLIDEVEVEQEVLGRYERTMQRLRVEIESYETDTEVD